jgi:hypothetical protein
MARLRGCLGLLSVLVATLFETTIARLINTTIYDTNFGHVTYEPEKDICTQWITSWVFWRTCEYWAQPWKSEIFHDHGRFTTVHRSLNNQLPSVAIKFEGMPRDSFV